MACADGFLCRCLQLSAVATTRCAIGWRASSVGVDLYAVRDDIFHDVQAIKESLHLNIELVRPEHFVPR
jgi:hypothetical protein